MEKQDKKPNIIAIIGAIVLLVLAVVGLSYAFFSAFINGGETDTSVEGTGANLSLVYTDGKSVITSSNIMPGWSATKTFTVTNNGEADTYYKLNISNITNEFVEGGLTFSIASTDGGANKDETPVGTEDRTISSSISIGVGKTHTYTITAKYINLDKDQTPDLGKSFSYTIGIEAGQKPLPTFAETILANNEVKAPITTPGAAISTASEALLASAEDDYGTSYYFRGAVTNNYVEFANKCWRIVRVGGDGSVKLILHNDNPTGAANPCDAANNSASAAFARYSGTTYKSAFNTNYNDNAYVGFKFGTVGSSTYEATHANTNNSTILTNLETWYTNNLKTYADAIADTVWCNDKTNVTDTSYDPWSITPNGLGYGTNTTYYGAMQRLVSTSSSAGGTGPSLKCNGELSKITSKVGLITADELAFAGYAWNIGNTTTYLQENATDTWWWSLSPYFFNGYNACVWRVNGRDGRFGYNFVYNSYGVRPSISLKPFTNVTGEGTSDKPFVVD